MSDCSVRIICIRIWENTSGGEKRKSRKERCGDGEGRGDNIDYLSILQCSLP